MGGESDGGRERWRERAMEGEEVKPTAREIAKLQMERRFSVSKLKSENFLAKTITNLMACSNVCYLLRLHAFIPTPLCLVGLGRGGEGRGGEGRGGEGRGGEGRGGEGRGGEGRGGEGRGGEGRGGEGRGGEGRGGERRGLSFPHLSVW